ncbi:MAG: DUF1634 domain-containing protein [Thermoplasmata archaeon]
MISDPTPPEGAAGGSRRLETASGRMALVLRIGLAASMIVFLGSITAYLLEHPGVISSSSVAGAAVRYLPLSALAAGLAHGDPVAYLTLGVLLLVATPIARVLSGLYYFQRGGERTMAGIALAVFSMLVFGLLVLGPLIR